MSLPVALQLYTVRAALARNFAGAVKRIAAMGYAGVEPAGFPGTTPQQAGRLFKDLGLAVPSAHVALPVGKKKNEVLDTLAALDCQCIVSMKGPDDFGGMARVRRTCDLFNEAQAVAVQNGLAFGIHNHWWEFQRVEDGRLAFDVMREHLDPAVQFEVDVYWVKTAGVDPAAVVRDVGPRAPLLHIKDGPAVQGQPMVAVGDGTLDFHSIIAAGGEHTRWLIVELDECATDMMTAVDRSIQYLVREGLGRTAK